jgi:formyltetrahydrofolate synthetase
MVTEMSIKAGAFDAVVCNHHALGGEGAKELGLTIDRACRTAKKNFKFLYPLNKTIKEKIEIIAREVYKASGVEYMPEAEEKIAMYTRQGFDELPICMAKTQYSFSHDAALKGAPSDFVLPIRDVRASVGAGFLYPLVGDMPTIPGLPTLPAYYKIDVDLKTGKIQGLS